MASGKKPAPQQVQQPVEPVEQVAPYTIDPDGNITVTGSISGEQFAQAQRESQQIREQKTESTKNKAIYGEESVATVEARQAQTIANPKKAKVRGRRSLVSQPIGAGAVEVLG